MKQTLKEAGYTFIRKREEDFCYILQDEFGKYELWMPNKNHASYGLKYKNTHLEFVRSMTSGEVQFVK